MKKNILISSLVLSSQWSLCIIHLPEPEGPDRPNTVAAYLPVKFQLGESFHATI